VRASGSFFLFIGGCLVLIASLFAVSERRVSETKPLLADLGEVTAVLKLTDMSFSTDARYTRHPSQADLFSAFQDYPGSIEHFPSGSVVGPPDFRDLATTLTIRKR
jgi:hypothetical protein